MSADLSSLSGDGINFSFFNLLWSKSCKEDGNKQEGVKQPTDNKKSPILRVPDTVRIWIGSFIALFCITLAIFIHTGLFSTSHIQRWFSSLVNLINGILQARMVDPTRTRLPFYANERPTSPWQTLKKYSSTRLPVVLDVERLEMMT